MATITFEGPDPTGQKPTAVSVLTVPDEMLLLAVQAACNKFGYQPTVPVLKDGESTGEVEANPEGPGTFAIWRTLDTWKQWVIEDQSRIAKQAAVSQVLQGLAHYDDKSTVESKE